MKFSDFIMHYLFIEFVEEILDSKFVVTGGPTKISYWDISVMEK